MNSIYKQLNTIRKRPELYFGEDYLCALQVFFDGFILLDNELTNEKDKDWYEGFLQYIYAYYHVNSAPPFKTWVSVIEDNSSSKKDACLTFFCILDDYTQQVGLGSDSCDDASNTITNVLNASDLQERKIQQNPLHYLPDYSVNSLWLFMFGYNMRQNINGMVKNTSYTCDEEFIHYIFTYLSIHEAETWKNWRMILDENTQSDGEGFRLYFEILDEYILEKNKGLYRKIRDVHDPNSTDIFSVYEIHPRKKVYKGNYILIEFNAIHSITRFRVENQGEPMELTGVVWKGRNAPTITVYGKHCGEIAFEIKKEGETWWIAIRQSNNNQEA